MTRTDNNKMRPRWTTRLLIYLIITASMHDNKRTTGRRIDCSKDCAAKSKCDNGSDVQENQGFPEKNCYCDPLCPILRDCCDALETPETDTPEVEKPEIASTVFDCVHIDGKSGTRDDMVGVTMVTRCGDNWPDDGVKGKCESEEDNNILLVVPVSEDKHNIVFRNMYCAICNHFDVFRYWTMSKMCQRFFNAKDCKWKYERPFLERNIRLCPLHMTDECSGIVSSSGDQDIVMNCESGDVSMVYSNDGTIYRNEHCAFCNGVPENGTFCECLYEPHVSVNTYGLTMLVDLNSGHMSDGNGEPVAMWHSCQNDSMYDPMTESCSPCESSFTVTRGVCRKTNHDQNTSRFDNSFTFDDVNVYLSMFTLIVSLAALALTFIIYTMFRELRNTPGKILMCLILSLFVAELLFLVSSHFQANQSACKVVSVVMHYFFLAAFCWMNIVALDLGITFSRQLSYSISDSLSMKRFLKFSVYGWIVPLAIVCIAVIVDFSDIDDDFSSLKPGYGASVCWITSRDALILFFFGPLALFKLFDVAAFIFTSVHIYRVKRQGAMARQNSNVCTYLVNLKLSLVMGLTWTFAFLANIVDVPALWYMFVVLNGLQGVFIGLGFLCTNKVRRLLSNRYGRKKRTQSSTQMSSLSTLN